MAALAPFVMKISFYQPTYQNQARNVANLNYIATRPGVDKGEIEPERDQEIHAQYMDERPGSHGLFDENGPADLDAVKTELKHHEGIVWRGIVSLREDEAIRINHLTRQQWEESLQKSFPAIAEKLNIPESNLRWAAAYHAEAGHPHCHFLFWEADPQRDKGQLSKGETRDVKKAFAKNIYAVERERLMIEKTYYRDEIRNGARDLLSVKKALAKESENIKTEIGDRPTLAPKITPEQQQELDNKLQSISEMLPAKGRIALKYMPQNVKTEIKATTEWLLKQPGFTQEVEKYLAAHSDLTKIYTAQEDRINEARDKALADLQTRVGQDILRASAQIKYKDLPTPELVMEYVPAVIEAFRTGSNIELGKAVAAEAKAKEAKEAEKKEKTQEPVKEAEETKEPAKEAELTAKEKAYWTVSAMSQSLKAFGVDVQERKDIIQGWLERSGIDIPAKRISDIVDRHEKADQDYHLGKSSFAKLMENIGVEEAPTNPWQYPKQNHNNNQITIANSVWKGIWRSLQRERTKSEYQARRMEAQQKIEERKKEARSR